MLSALFLWWSHATSVCLSVWALSLSRVSYCFFSRCNVRLISGIHPWVLSSLMSGLIPRETKSKGADSMSLLSPQASETQPDVLEIAGSS